jgi:hypothetical protein
MHTIQIAALLGFLGLAAGCEPVLYSAQIEVEEACVSGLTFEVPASVATPGQDLAIDAQQPLSTGDLASGLPDDVELEVQVVEVGITAVSGVADLSFLDRLGITAMALDPTTITPPVTMVQMGDDDHTDDGAMRAAPANPVDITDMLRSSDVLFGVLLAGELPASGWQGALDVCVHTRAKYSRPL